MKHSHVGTNETSFEVSIVTSLMARITHDTMTSLQELQPACFFTRPHLSVLCQSLSLYK